MGMRIDCKNLKILLMALVVLGLWLAPSYAAPDKKLMVEVTPAAVPFEISNPEVSGTYYATQEVTVTSYHILGKTRRWGIFINAELPYLIEPRSNERIPIGNLEWSADGVVFTKLSTGKALVIRHEGRKDQVFEDRIYYRLLFDSTTSPGAYSVTINFDGVWGEVYTDLDEEISGL